MRKAAMLLVLVLSCGLVAAAQSSTTADQQSPATTPSSTGNPSAQDPANPQKSMPPDTKAPAPQSTAPAPANTTPATNSDKPQSDMPAQPGMADRTEPAPGTPRIATGTEIRATLDSQITTKTAKVGDPFSATIVEPVRTADGAIALPSGSKIEGEVSEAEQGKTLAILRGKGRLNLRFHDVQLPDGSSVPLAATLVSVNEAKGGSASDPNNEGQVQSTTSGKTAAKDVGIGAGAGTVAGLIFGSALKGLAIGALAGGGYVLATKGKDVDLPAQTGLRLRVDRNIPVPANAVLRQ